MPKSSTHLSIRTSIHTLYVCVRMIKFFLLSKDRAASFRRSLASDAAALQVRQLVR